MSGRHRRRLPLVDQLRQLWREVTGDASLSRAHALAAQERHSEQREQREQ